MDYMEGIIDVVKVLEANRAFNLSVLMVTAGYAMGKMAELIEAIRKSTKL
jgi:hypothetical protein